jgi:hypothetical protein
MDLGNVNIVEEQKNKYASHPMFKQHSKMMYETEDLHMALKSCNEIGSAKTLYSFLIDLQKIEGSKIPMQQDVKRIRKDSTFQRFLNSIIVCTEQGYRNEDLQRLVQQQHRLDYADKYIDLLSEIIKELLRE